MRIMENINYSRLGKYKRLFILDCIKPRIVYLKKAFAPEAAAEAVRDCYAYIELSKRCTPAQLRESKRTLSVHNNFYTKYISEFNKLEFKKSVSENTCDYRAIAAKLIFESLREVNKDYGFSPTRCMFLLNGAVGLVCPVTWNNGFSNIRQQQNNIYRKYVRENQESVVVSEVNESHVLSVRRRMFFEEDR